jgi:predicted DNA-binding mobile mystery protein A
MKKYEKAKQARVVLDSNLGNLNNLLKLQPPKVGWIRAIRESLGMSREQLGSRIKSPRTKLRGLTASAVQSLELQEANGTITLASLDRAASAMQCSLFYVLIPNQSLEQIVQDRAIEVAANLEAGVSQTMKLEAQDYDQKIVNQPFINRLIEQPGLWKNGE